jgi:hypothetical protein
MAWTPAQIKEAKRLYNRKGNRLSWADCIKRATKGGARKSAPKKRASVGAKKPARKVVKTVTRKSITKISGLAGNATSELVQVQRKITSEKAAIDKLKGRSMAGMGAADKKALRADITRRKQYIQQLNKHKTAIKRFI